MKIKISALFLVAIFSICFSSCTKDDAATPDVKTLLLSKTWTFKTVTHPKATNAAAATLIASLLSGQTYIFKSDGTYSGVALSFPISGTWVLSADSKTLTLDTDVNKISVTSSSFTLEDTDGYLYTYK